MGSSTTARASTSRIDLGGSDLSVSPLGLGTLSWGDPKDGYGTRYNDASLREIYSIAREAGVNFFDTAEVYGYQGIKDASCSECILGELAQEEAAGEVVVGTKFFTIPWTNLLVGGGVRLGRQALIKALRASVLRLGLPASDLYSIHFPFPTFSQEVLSEGLKQALDEGLCTAVGVSNYDAAQMTEMAALLQKSGVPLASNQVKYNLVDRSVETNGVAAACRDLGVTLVAHSPLEQGLLTSAALARNDPANVNVKPLLKIMELLGSFSGGKSVSQVALNYLMCKGAIPIPGCTTPDKMRDIVGAMGWQLDENDIGVLDEKADYLFKD